MWKSEILVTGKDFDGSQIWLTGVVDKSGNVAIVVSINTKGVSILE